MVYALVLGTSGAILGGSSPLLGTLFLRRGAEFRPTVAGAFQFRHVYKEVCILYSEAWGGIEPPYIPFAEECLTTWLPRRYFCRSIKIALLEKHEYFPAGKFLCSAQSACASLFSKTILITLLNFYIIHLSAVRQFFDGFFLPHLSLHQEMEGD